jgi:hypothetical protein
MKLIETKTLTSAQSSIVFSSIPQNFMDLMVLVSDRSSRPAGAINDGVEMKLNGVSQTGKRLYGSGSGAVSDNGTSIINPALATTANVFSNIQFYIPNYANTTITKSWSADGVMENNATLSYQTLVAGLYSSTSAVTSITFVQDQGPNTEAGTTISLYGIGGAGDGGPKATGGMITRSGDYWVHTFTASGTFTPTANISNVEYLVVAGGGSGGGYGAGGGGAGGYRCSVTGENSGGGASAEAKLSLTSGTAYTVTVGAGGAGGANIRNNGVNSSFGAITSVGGGFGDNQDSGTTPASGGSGGGAAPTSAPGQTGGAGTANQGYAGGNSAAVDTSGAGGGGAGAVGQNAGLSYGPGGDGGTGVASSITGTSIFRAGGGGGFALSNTNDPGTGGAGGGGNGNILQFGVGTNLQSATAGAANTGGGGGGGSAGGGTDTAPGGSGIVIVRYAV